MVGFPPPTSFLAVSVLQTISPTVELFEGIGVILGQDDKARSNDTKPLCVSSGTFQSNVQTGNDFQEGSCCPITKVGHEEMQSGP